MTSFPQDAADLASGQRMPLLGFGTWQIRGSRATDAVGWALETGYRHLDTATMYGNEQQVGAGVAGSGVERADVFITTKCPPRNVGRELDTLRTSLEQLDTGYVDLWLIHWPPGRRNELPMWKAFGEAAEQGLARSIGVSNFGLDQIDELSRETGVTPAVNQIEWSPLLFDRAVLDGHRERGIVLEGYSALKGGALGHPVITGIADRLGRTAAQVIIRWHLQHGVVVIPKSTHQERIRSNADVGFELSADDMAALDALGQS